MADIPTPNPFDPADRGMRCPVCAYDLGGISHSGNCPECGTALRPALLRNANLRAREASTKLWCILGIIAWALAGAIHWLIEMAALSLGRSFGSTVPSATQITLAWMRPLIALIPIALLTRWLLIRRRLIYQRTLSAGPAARPVLYRVVAVSLLGILIDAAFVAMFFYLLLA